jgi:hypothetical protein
MEAEMGMLVLVESTFCTKWRTWSRQRSHSARSHPVKVRFGLTTSDLYRPNYSPSIAILGPDDGADRGSKAIRQPEQVEAANDNT